MFFLLSFWLFLFITLKRTIVSISLIDEGMDTSSLIVSICVAIPAAIAITVCAVVFYSYRNKTRKIRRQENPSYEYHHSYERRSQDDYPRTYPYQQQRRLREPSLVFEQSPPLYNPHSTYQIRRQQLPLFSPVYTTPTRANVHQTPITINPSVHAAMPPSYDELFLTPHTLTNR